MKEVDILEEFIDWFISREGKSHNYLRHDFAGSQEKLKSELHIYAELYELDFNSKLFQVSLNLIDEKIGSEDAKNIKKRLFEKKFEEMF